MAIPTYFLNESLFFLSKNCLSGDFFENFDPNTFERVVLDLLNLVY